MVVNELNIKKTKSLVTVLKLLEIKQKLVINLRGFIYLKKTR